MLEVFDWTNDMVFESPEVRVVAAIDPSLNHLDRFRFRAATIGIVFDGHNIVLRQGWNIMQLQPGSYFVATGYGFDLCSPGGRILLINMPGKDFPFSLGGPIEPHGRLRYIDGCTDSLLVPPWRRGEPCLNHLHIPPGVEQTMHTHPSDRIGLVMSGRGQCVSPDGTTDLHAGMIWRIPAGGLHRFRTDADAIQIIAFHPDSDFGPADEDHPMLNRSLVGGVSAKDIPEIRTQ